MYKKYCLIASILLIIPIFTTSMEVEEEEEKVEQREQQKIHNLVKQLQDPNELNTWLKAGRAKLLNKEFFGHMRDQLMHNIRPTPQYLQQKKLNPSKALTGHNKKYPKAIRSVAFNPDGTKLASGSEDRTVKLWSVKTGKEILTLTGHGIRGRIDIVGRVYSVAFSPGTKLASGSEDRTIKLWDVETGNEIRTLTGHGVKQPITGTEGEVYSVAFSPDGTKLASGSSDYTIKLWDVETGNEIRTLTGHTKEVNSVAFSPKDTTLASGSSDYTIKLWDVKTGNEIHTLTGHTDKVNSVVFSPNGTTLASGSWDNTVKLWDVKTGNEIHTFKWHDPKISPKMALVGSVAFSPDGTILASAAKEKTIKLWNVKTGTEVLDPFTEHKDIFTSVAFNSYGTMLASGTTDGTIVLWPLVNLKDVEQLSIFDLLLINALQHFRTSYVLLKYERYPELYKIYNKSSALAKKLIPLVLVR